MKLKTLKDLNMTYMAGMGELGNIFVDSKELKQEAIKWVKSKEKNLPGTLHIEFFKEGGGGVFGNSGYMFDNKGAETIEFLIHFFNITEEDLK